MDPLTIAVMGMQAVGGLLKGITGYAAGKAEAQRLEMRADQARQESAIRANVLAEEADEVAGEAAVLGAAGGGGLSGSFADVLGDIERKGRFNVRSAIWAGHAEAQNALYEAQVANKDAGIALLTGFMDAGTSVAGGFGKAAEAKKQAAARRKL